jgi:hypothetical protein
MRLALGSWAAQAAQEAKEEAARAEGYRAAIEAVWARSQRAQDGAPSESGAASSAAEAERLSAALSPQPSAVSSATWPTAAASETRGMGGPSAQQERAVGELVEAAEQEEAELACAGTSGGRKLRAGGMGVHHANGAKGDLIAGVQIMLPETEDAAVRERLLEAAKAASGTSTPRAQLRW